MKEIYQKLSAGGWAESTTQTFPGWEISKRKKSGENDWITMQHYKFIRAAVIMCDNLTYWHTQSGDRQSVQTDSCWPVILLAQPA